MRKRQKTENRVVLLPTILTHDKHNHKIDIWKGWDGHENTI